MENENKNLIAALKYASIGWSVIPIGTDKKCLIKWEAYQHGRATKEEIEEWFKKYPDANVGVVTGAISGIVVIDIDTKEPIGHPLPLTVASRTASGGQHIFCIHPGYEVKNRVRIIENVDIRADGGYVVLPPSLLSTGSQYEWMVPPGEVELAELPRWVLAENKSSEKTTNSTQIFEGSRNATAAQLAGKMLGALSEDTWEMVWLSMKGWNQTRCTPPLSETELKTVFESISNRELKKRTESGESKPGYEVDAVILSQLVKTEYKDTEWLVEKLIPHEALTIITGAPATYKTFITLEIAIKVATGGKLFGKFQTRESPVLIIDEENHPRILKGRAKLLLQNPELPIFVASKKGFLLRKDSVDKIIEFAKNRDIQLVIFDSLICIHDADENTASEMRKVMKQLKEITNHGVAVIVIHHHGKSEGISASQKIRGSSDILAQVDSHLSIERKNKETSVVIEQNKLREGQEIPPFVVRFHSDGNSGYFEYGGESKGKTNTKESLKASIKKVLEEAQKPLNKTELWKSVEPISKGRESTYKSVVKQMIEAGELFTKQGIKNTVYCSLAKFTADDG